MRRFDQQISSSSWLRSPWVGKVVLQDLECGFVQRCPVIFVSPSKSDFLGWRATYNDFPTNLFHIFLFIERLTQVSPSKLKRFRVSILHVGAVVHSNFQAENNLFTVVISLGIVESSADGIRVKLIGQAALASFMLLNSRLMGGRF